MIAQHKCSLLIVVDDEPYIRATLSALTQNEFEVLTTDSGKAAQQIVVQRGVDLILADQKMRGMSGVELLEWMRERSPKTIRLLMTGLAELKDALEAINRGKVHSYLFKPWRAEELLETLGRAARTFHRERQYEELLQELHAINLQLEQRVQDYTRTLEEAIRELRQKIRVLEELALIDPLTGLLNRRAVDQLGEAEMRQRERYPSPLVLGYIDADRFKVINTRYLMPGGDQVLVDLGRVLSASARRVDTLGRVGGEEFIIIAPDTDLQGAVILGERLRSAVEEFSFSYRGEPIQVTISIGLVAVVGVAVDYDQLKYLAAGALAEAKAKGGNRCIVRALP